ncbi:serum response factor-binding protein 1 [Drosophila virilis]|uniref:Serum response factor-binding protein 1 n=1 Tax=Drosophila virilis TaxID=7244 RepID=B4M425_DROVI|nr:uncharacterized protein PFB0765w [Drosophila virilis]EDW59386.1 uncharacterized protein Dvir_GJ10856 [Drosophila virilis]
MFNKLEFNNLVITNKKQIQQARAQTIARVVNKLRKLKDELKRKPESEKHQERLRKSVECISELKSLKCMDIMRTLLLQNGKNHKAVLTNGRATPDEVAIAMLGLNKIMQMLVAAFQLALDLGNKANDDWRTAILETSKRRLKLERTEEKRRKRKELKEQKAQTRNRMIWLQQNQPPGEDKCEQSVINTAAGECLIECPLTPILKGNGNNKEIQDNSMLISLPDLVEKTKHKIPKCNENQQKVHEESKKRIAGQPEIEDGNRIAENSPQLKEVVVNPKRKKIKKLENKPKQEKTNSKPTGQKANAVVENKTQREKAGAIPNRKERKEVEPKPMSEKAEVNRKRQTAKEPEKERPTHVVDPFFITESGQPYLSTAVVLSGDSHNESDDNQHVEQRKRKPLAKKQEYNSSRSNERHNHERSNERHNYERSNERHNNERSNERHPSWMAKQQQKPIIANYKGRKTKFNDDDSVAEISTAPVAAPSATDAGVTGMHPSWLAKQKLKPKIAKFAGKKIKFDD